MMRNLIYEFIANIVAGMAFFLGYCHGYIKGTIDKWRSRKN